MKEQLLKIQQEFQQDLLKINSEADFSNLRIKYLGRKSGKLNDVLRNLKNLPKEQKRELGPLANSAKQKIEQELQALQNKLDKKTTTQIFKEDLSLPGIKPTSGHLHPLSLAANELMDIFSAMGFMIYEGPELENDFYNFESLNIPPSHPARDMQDTFFIKDHIKRQEKRKFSENSAWVMRTHTSNMQVRIMEQFQPPLRCVVPGRVFRNEATDASHEHTFYQLEGFVVDKNITIGHAMWTLKEILRQVFKKDIRIRLRPGYFPFVEPGYELDCSCLICNGQGCPTCKRSGWVELVPCGMIHPNVFKAAGYPKGTYTGFAFGLGLSRLTMMKYGISNIRLFTENDLRFLKQF
ncbi:MAG: phenylalanine--tRNA ligase subunit alpha [Candidatus Kerfeldbacteria bacterium RIFOXYA2_FULL_38_24]|uniref:Phenylalanine--tRNA ligase alpha subunit n=1 Tax=Candidatus Kerfeldbacteria bacterium RIFOXYB2_FULL_38_14 TaxID=1798547 RepID=A0A1G2BBS4_9BACT|nr:MAG: phenylalanine--tRNA ligase subunit alpha [Candidatus Kerfeldbacteria bacterium RIFOXYA2_FULL_38_24]OGY86019.1 MAG: phenylalanine--tRNA ligase subunit alpha [Candidatus Kerfeldbacteria bacterium RIFOXYB2_FULL_38_14]